MSWLAITFQDKNATVENQTVQKTTFKINPGVSMMVRFGQWAYSALMTIGFGDTAL